MQQPHQVLHGDNNSPVIAVSFQLDLWDLNVFMRKVLVLCPGNMFTKSSDLLEEGIGRSGPDERAGLGIVGSDEVFVGLQAWFHALKNYNIQTARVERIFTHVA